MSTSQPRSAMRGYLIALCATALWSSTGIVISYLNRTYGLPSLALAFWRDFSLTLALTLFFLAFQRERFNLSSHNRAFMALFGLIVAIFNSAWTFSVQFNGAAVATVLAFSSPAFTAILSHWILKERITAVKFVSVVLSISGIVLVSGAWSLEVWRVNLAGILFGLFTGLVFAAYNIMGKTASNRGIDSWTTLLYSFGIATAFLFLFNLGFDAFNARPLLGEMLWLGGSVPGWTILILLGIGPTLGGFGLYTLSLDYLPATVSNLIATLEPVLTSIWAYFIFGESLSPVQIIGGTLVFLSVILLRVKG